jgi:hypothetical protein
MYNCALCEKYLVDVYAYEFDYMYGRGLNRIWNEKFEKAESNQHIYRSGCIDAFCTECIQYLTDFDLNVGSEVYDNHILDIFSDGKIINQNYSIDAKNPHCMICSEQVVHDYYGISLTQVFLKENGINTYDSYFLSAICEECDDFIYQEYKKDKIPANVQYYFMNNKYNKRSYIPDKYPFQLQ